MTPDRLWVYLATQPLFWLTLTLVAYAAADRLAVRTGRHPVANPVLMAVALVAAVLMITGTPYARYFEGAQFIHFLLGPATVALALPLYAHRAVIKRSLVPILAALVLGSLTAVISAVGIAWLFNVPDNILASLAPKSVTAAIAMGISREVGGDPALTATLVITTGVMGAMMVTPLMNAMGLRDYRARGFAAGLASHGIGTARAFQVDPLAGAFAGIAMGLNGLITAVLVPPLLALLR
jgi:predicted murein hydrolase (TIGR00659 family)